MGGFELNVRVASSDARGGGVQVSGMEVQKTGLKPRHLTAY